MKSSTSEEVGRAVPEGFALPWNTTVTMADAWAAEFAEAERIRLERHRDAQRRHRARNAEIRGQVVKAIKADDRRRVTTDCAPHSTLPKITAAGKFAYAGYDGSEM